MTRKVIAVQVPPEHQMSPWEDREPQEGLVIIHEVNRYRHITTYGEDTEAERIIRFCEDWSGDADNGRFYEDAIELLDNLNLEFDEYFLELRRTLDYSMDEDEICRVLNLLVGGNWRYKEGCDFARKERAEFYWNSYIYDGGYGGIDDIITEYFNDGNEWEVMSYVDGVEEDRLMVYCHNAEDSLLEIAWAISVDPDNIELEWYED